MNNGFLRVLRRVVAYWRMIVVLLIFALATAIVLQGQFVSFELLLLTLLLIFIASQIFWIGRVVDLGQWLLPRRVCRRRVATGVVLAYLFVVAYSFPTTIAPGHIFRIGVYRLPIVVTETGFWCWFVGSLLAFLLVMAFGLVDRLVSVSVWTYRKVRQPVQHGVSGNSEAASSPSRRLFLQHTAVMVSATPFVAAGYWLLFEPHDVGVVRQGIRLAGPPQFFHRVCISHPFDLHMG